jgi:hypothetical protein
MEENDDLMLFCKRMGRNDLDVFGVIENGECEGFSESALLSEVVTTQVHGILCASNEAWKIFRILRI